MGSDVPTSGGGLVRSRDSWRNDEKDATRCVRSHPWTRLALPSVAITDGQRDGNDHLYVGIMVAEPTVNRCGGGVFRIDREAELEWISGFLN